MSAASPTLPEKLGKYEIRREVGRGGMGIVYEGFDPLISRRVALKTFINEYFDGTQSDNLLTRLRREAQAAGRLNHPNIIAVYDYGEEANTAFIAMEFVEGRSLESCFAANERLPIREVERIMSELLDALQYSHDHGVVHRDIKPANIILLKDGTVKVADFGVARIESSTLTQFGTVLGSPNYMSPEQFMGQTVDGRSDLYSAGVVLYQLLTAEVPFTGAFTTIMHRVLNETAPPPSVLNVQVPRGFDAIVTRAMAKRPDERYQSAAEFKQAILSAPSGAAQTATGTVMRTTPETSAAAVPPGRQGALSPAALFSILGIVLVAVAGGGYYLWHARTERQSLAALPPPETQTASPPAAAVPADADAGTSLISAVGVANPADPSFANDPGGAARTVWADARRQVVAKAAALYVQPASLGDNFAVVQAKLLTHSDDFITTVVQQPTPQLSQDGLMVGTLMATVNVRDVQKSLNKISAEDRVEFIRNHGDPRISVSIRDATSDGERSELAENILKERIKSFGFTVVDDAAAKPPADFHVDGEVRFKRLSARLPASGLLVEKFVLTSWTVKAVDAKTGEEIYHNTAVPDKQSWASRELAMQDVGRLIGAQFTQSFFLQYFDFKPRKARLRFSGLPPIAANVVLTAVTGSLVVLNAAPVAQTGSDVVIDTELSGGSDSVTTTIQHAVLDPLNRRIGVPCFSLGAGDPAELHILFDATCTSAATINRLESAPPDALTGTPSGSPSGTPGSASPLPQKNSKVPDLPGKVTT